MDRPRWARDLVYLKGLKQQGAEIIECYDAAPGWRKYFNLLNKHRQLKNDYDLLITDLMFPDGIGTGLIKAFNKKKEDARSLLVTGSVNVHELLAEEGVSEYVEKPFKVEKFLETVNKVLS